jgi:hypothetical protein
LQGGSDTDAVDTEGEQEEDQGQGASRASTSVTVLPKVIQSVLTTGPGGQQGQHISYCPTQGDSVSVDNRARGPAMPAHQLPSYPR